MRAGIRGSMHPDILKISVDSITNERHRNDVIGSKSPESYNLQTTMSSVDRIRMNQQFLSEAHIVGTTLDFCRNRQMKELKDTL